MHDLIPLSQLHPGQRAQIEAVLGPPEQVHRLHELGLRGGIEVRMVQPGSPCIVMLGDQRICFRSDELLRVLVKPGVTA